MRRYPTLSAGAVAPADIIIARDVTIAAYCYLLAGGNHEFDRIDLPVLEQPSYHKGGVSIGAGSWRAAKVTVLDGV